MDDLQKYAEQVNALLPQLAIKLIRFVKDIQDYDITIAQAFLLHNLKMRGACTASAIGEMMEVTSGPVTSITQRLIKRGLIHRRQDEKDRRVVWFTLTSEGEAVLQAIREHNTQKWAIVLEQLGPETAQATIALMERTIRVLNDL